MIYNVFNVHKQVFVRNLNNKLKKFWKTLWIFYVSSLLICGITRDMTSTSVQKYWDIQSPIPIETKKQVNGNVQTKLLLICTEKCMITTLGELEQHY